MNLKAFWSDIKGAEHSFAKWASTLWKDVEKDEPEIASIVDDGLNYIGPALGIVVSDTAGAPAGAAVASIVAGVQSKLKAVSGLVHDFGADKSVTDVLQTAASDVSSIGAVANLGSKAQSAVSKVIGEIQVLAGAVAKTVAAATGAGTQSAPGAGNTAGATQG